MKVSAIMPTRNRREFIPTAIKSLLAQDWLSRRNYIRTLELVVVDDGDDSVEKLVRDLIVGSSVLLQYVRMAREMEPWQRTIGAKRNLACECATGDAIVHWDDDDWSADSRISEQLLILIGTHKAVTGYHTMLFWEGEKQRASLYSNGEHYALGSSLCYLRSWWKDHRFPDKSIGEDNEFVQAAHSAGMLASIPGGKTMVARTHPGNTSLNKFGFPAVATEEIPDEFFRAIGYSEAAIG